MQSLGFTSVPPLLKYLRHAEQLGMAIEPALAAAGLQAQQLSDNTLRLPGEAHEKLLDYFCEHSGDPLFGLNAANFVLPNSWSVLGYITMNCATLGDAMSRIMPFEKLVGDMGVSRAEVQDGQAVKEDLQHASSRVQDSSSPWAAGRRTTVTVQSASATTFDETVPR